MARVAIDPDIKARALADLLDGDQPAVVAMRYGIPGGTVRQWKARLVTPDVTQSVTPSVTARPAIEAQQLALGDLVMENLRAKLLATQGIAQHVIKAGWLEKQSAADVAELFEVIDRSATGILDRLAQHGRADASAPDPDEQSG